MKKSEFLKLDVFDILKGIFMAIIGAVLAYVHTIAETGNLTDIDWRKIASIAAAASISYLLKNLFSNSQDKPFLKEKK